MNDSLHAYQFEVVFPIGYDDRGKYEAEERGALYDVRVLVGDKVYCLSFVTLSRAQVDLEFQIINEGEKYLADPGLILMPIIREKEVFEVVEALVKSRFFEKLVPDSVP